MIYRSTQEKIKLIKSAYETEGRLTVRRIYYILLSNGLIKHSENSYTGLSTLLTKLREQGYLDPRMIIDQHRKMIQRTTYSDFDEAFEECCDYFSINTMALQNKYVEVWIEKDTMTSIFLNRCYFSDVPLIISKGFTSYSFKHEFLDRLKENSEKPCIVLYFGDFDAEGNFIPFKVEEFVNEKLGTQNIDFELKKVLLTEADIPKIENFGIIDKGLSKKKHLEKQYVQDYVKKYGKKKYEVEALSFNEVQDRFIKALGQEIDFSIVEQADKLSKEQVESWKRKYNIEG